MAAVNLGVLLREQGDLECVRSAFQLAIDSSHADAAERARFLFAKLTEQRSVPPLCASRLSPVDNLLYLRVKAMASRGATPGAMVDPSWAQ